MTNVVRSCPLPWFLRPNMSLKYYVAPCALSGREKEQLEASGDLLVQNFNHSSSKGGHDTWRPYHSEDEDEDDDDIEEADDDDAESDYEVDRLGNRIEKQL